VLSLLLQRLTAWLCLALASLTGLAPAQGFVLCLDTDGCVRVDLAAPAGHCQCCDGEQAGETNEALPSRAGDDSGCACVDLLVCGAAQDRLHQHRPVAPQLGPWIAPSPGSALLSPVSITTAARPARAGIPRPPDSLALIRSVVLLL
jgi:hypothetical protein